MAPAAWAMASAAWARASEAWAMASEAWAMAAHVAHWEQCHLGGAQGDEDRVQASLYNVASLCNAARPRGWREGVGPKGRSDRICREQQEEGGEETHEHAMTYVEAKETYEEAKEACVKETCGEAKEACGEAKETYVEAKEASPELAHGFTDVEVEEYREAFGLFDQDGGGTITAVEIGTVLRSIGPPPPP